MVSNLEELVNERDLRIKELKKQIALSVRKNFSSYRRHMNELRSSARMSDLN